MSDPVPERLPKTQPASSGGPPQPPKKTARGLDDQSPRNPQGQDITRRLLDEYSKRMTDPELSDASRVKIKKHIEELRKHISKEG